MGQGNSTQGTAMKVGPSGEPGTPSTVPAAGVPSSTLPDLIPPMPTDPMTLPPPSPPTEPQEPPSLFPGTVQELHKTRELFPVATEGVTVLFNKMLNSHFQVGHKFTYGAMSPSSYKYSTTYVGNKKVSTGEAFPVLLGELEANGNLNAQILHSFSEVNRSRAMISVQNGEWKHYEIGTDFKTNGWTVSTTLANLDLINMKGIGVAQVIYGVTNNTALGLEFACGRVTDPFSRQSMLNMSQAVLLKYKDDKQQVGAQVGFDSSVHASYYRKVGEEKEFGCEIEGKLGVMTPERECTATVGFSMKVPKTHTVCKACVDTKFNLISAVETKLLPLPVTLGFNVQGSLVKSQFLAGISCTFG